MANRRLVAMATVALLAWTHPVAAQRFRGQVVLPDSATPASGAVVVATGNGGAPVVRSLTDERGSFDLLMPHAGRFELRVLRIGFRPTVAGSFDVAANETRSLRIVVAGDRISLPRVTVRGDDLCHSEREAGVLVASVWEEARKALMATQLVADRPLVAEWIEFDRALDTGGTRVLSQRVRTMRTATRHAFISRPADSLAATGYIVTDSASTTFYAPDADVLLSESFAATHCFHIEPPPPGRADLIGVGFNPSRDKSDAREIEGSFWLDRASAELRWLEYRYTNVGAAAQRAGAGGRVEFLRLASGEWLVSRWSIRMPRLGMPRLGTLETISLGGTAQVVGGPREATVREVDVMGGEVTSVSRGDSLLYRATGTAFTVQVVSRDSLVPAGGTSVSLIGTDYAATPDASGRARISPVLAGRYRARVRSALMDSLGASPIERDVELTDGLARIDYVALPTAASLLRTACGRDVAANNESLLRGTVRDSLGRSAPQAAVTIVFQTNVTTATSQKGNDGLSWSEQTLGALTDDSGHWHVCGVPREKIMSVRVATDAGADARRMRLDAETAFATADLVLWRSKAIVDNAMAMDLVNGTHAAAASAVVEISVATRSGAPLPEATVDIVPLSGPSRTVRTLASGHALVPAVEPGLVRVRARRVGFKAGELSVRVLAGRNTVPIILDEVRSPTLDTVRVMGNKRVLARYQDFEARLRSHAATASFTEEDIEKRNPTQTWQMLTTLPSLDVTDRQEHGTFMVVATARRGMVVDVLTNQPCFMKVIVDGMMVPAEDAQGRTNLSYLPPPSSIHGIEVFAGAASIPLQYGGAGDNKWCGLIAIWTK